MEGRDIKSFFLVLTFLVFVLASCHPIKNEVDQIALKCGSVDSTQSVFIRVINSENQPIAQPKSNLSAFFVPDNGANGSEFGRKIPVTDKGCVALQKGSKGRIDLYTKIPRESYTRSINTQELKDLSSLQLMPTIDRDLNVKCPAEGYFASDQLDVELNLSGFQDGRNERIRIIAYEEDKAQGKVVYEKAFGRQLKSPVVKVDVSDLNDGKYQVFASKELLDARSNDENAEVSSSESCALTILSSPPELPEPLRQIDNNTVLALGSVISWDLVDNTNLRFCRAEVSDNGETCNDPEDFVNETRIVNDKEGRYHYCFYIRHKGGLESPRRCKKVVVSGRGPSLSIDLVSPTPTRDFALIDYPYRTVEYRVEAKHPIVRSEEILGSLKCKVSLLLPGEVRLSGKNIICRSQTCWGQTLEEFRACGQNLSIDISDVYGDTLVDHSKLELKVKANDMAGNEQHLVHTIHLVKDRWKLVSLSTEIEDNSKVDIDKPLPHIDGQTQISTNDGRILGYSFESAIWLEKLDITKLGGESSSIEGFENENNVVSPDGRLYSLWSEDELGKSIIVYRNQGGSWKLFTSLDNQPYCSLIDLDPMNRLYCYDWGVAYVWDEGIWEKVEIGDRRDQSKCKGMVKFYKTATRYWARCGGYLYSRPHGQSEWLKRVEHELGYVESIHMDQRGNIWVQGGPWSDKFDLGFYDSAGNWLSTIEDGKMPDMIKGRSYLMPTPQGDMQYANYIWKHQEARWQEEWIVPRPVFAYPVGESTLTPQIQLGEDRFVVRPDDQDLIFQVPADEWEFDHLSTPLDYNRSRNEFFLTAKDLATEENTKKMISFRQNQYLDWSPYLPGAEAGSRAFFYPQNARNSLIISMDNQKFFRVDPDSRVFTEIKSVRLDGINEGFFAPNGQLLIQHGDGRISVPSSDANHQSLEVARHKFDPQLFTGSGSKLWLGLENEDSLYQFDTHNGFVEHPIPKSCLGNGLRKLFVTESDLLLVSDETICMTSQSVFAPRPLPFLRAGENPNFQLRDLHKTENGTFYLEYEDSASLKLQEMSAEFNLLGADIALPAGPPQKIIQNSSSSVLYAIYLDEVLYYEGQKWNLLLDSEKLETVFGTSRLSLLDAWLDKDDSLLITSSRVPLIRVFLPVPQSS